jgi:hypothetical protein
VEVDVLLISGSYTHLISLPSAPYPNLAAIANKKSSVIINIMIAEKITAFITT